MKTSKEYYSSIVDSERERFFACKTKAQRFFDEKKHERASNGVASDHYHFSYFYNDNKKGQMQGPIPFNAKLLETDYIRLLTLQLFEKDNLTYNRILLIVPDIIQEIDTQVESNFVEQSDSAGCQPYIVIFDEVIEDAKAIEKRMPSLPETSSQELKPYEFTIWIDGNYYYDDEEIEEEILLSDKDIETIKRLVREYDGDLSCGLMPILKGGDERLYNRFYSIIFPPVFYEMFQRDEMFEPIPGDEGKDWDEDDVLYLMETYGDHYDFDDAYICYIPEDMMPPKMKLKR